METGRRGLGDEIEGTTQSGEDALSVEHIGQELVPALTVLYHRDSRMLGKRALLREIQVGREAALSRFEPRFARIGDATDRGEPLADQRLSRQPVILAPRVGGGVRIVVSPSRTRVRYRGSDITEKRDISVAELLDGGVLELGGAMALVLHSSQALSIADEEQFTLIGRSHSMQRVRTDIRRLSDLEAPVLIRGETGTGKELAARALHTGGKRANRPFVAVNLGAIPPSLAAAELFGARRGAYTGASGRLQGYFQQAQGGTLFLDEIGEALPEVQVLLLRAIEAGEFQSLGGGDSQPLRARIVTATDANLEQLIQEKAFRAPLLHRLSACEVHLPPLRARREDLVSLVLHFLRLECAEQDCPFLLDQSEAEGPPWLSLRLMVKLAAYDWPGNVRQLRNVVRQMVLSSKGLPTLDLPAQLKEQMATDPRPAAVPIAPVRRKPSDISEAELLVALEENRWDLKSTAEALGLARPSLYTLLDRLPHIRTARAISTEEIQQSYRDCNGDLDVMAGSLRVSRSALRRRLRELGLR
ncbi:MAG TPA: sigma 54-interacting transcriptional regulator [Polyangium sp.]|nr:sigma 54-interacting transcriptional regulator [Polyangium sp.]